VVGHGNGVHHGDVAVDTSLYSVIVYGIQAIRQARMVGFVDGCFSGIMFRPTFRTRLQAFVSSVKTLFQSRIGGLGAFAQRLARGKIRLCVVTCRQHFCRGCFFDGHAKKIMAMDWMGALQLGFHFQLLKDLYRCSLPRRYPRRRYFGNYDRNPFLEVIHFNY